jgi:hypothetical protein
VGSGKSHQAIPRKHKLRLIIAISSQSSSNILAIFSLKQKELPKQFLGL